MRVAREMAMIVLMTVVTSIGGPSVTAAQETSGYATPDEAIAMYLAGVASADAGRILAATAIDEPARRFDFAGSVDRLQAMMLWSSLAPAQYPLYAETNRAKLTDRILSQATNLTYSLLSSAPMDGRTVAPADRVTAQAFIDEVDTARLADLRVVVTRFPDATQEHSTRYLANSARLAAIYGADELTDRVVLLAFENGLYEIGLMVVRYGDGWKVLEQASPIGGFGSSGVAVPTTVEEFDRTTAGDE